jgi:hypothetical protein
MKNRVFLFFVLFMVAMLSGLQSCGPAHRLAKQDKQDHKLYKEVISNDRVLPKAANVWNMLNPIGQKIVYIKGKETTIIDSIPYDVIRDSLIRIECPSVNFDSLKKVWTKIIYQLRTDTLTYPDTTCWRRVDIIQSQYNTLQGRYSQQTEQVASLSKSQKKTSLWLIGVSILAGIIIAGLTYLLFRK